MSMKRFKYAWALLPALGLGVLGCEREAEQPAAPTNDEVEVERELDGDIEAEREVQPPVDQPGTQTQPPMDRPGTQTQPPRDQATPPADDLGTQTRQGDEEFEEETPVLDEEQDQQDQQDQPLPGGGGM